jgi:hypothetical protein
MGHFRFSVSGLMVFVIAAAIGLTALTHPTPLWASAIFSFALLANFAAVVATIASEGVARKAAAGFWVCGWGYLLISLAPGLESSVALQLITTRLLERFYLTSADAFSLNRVAHSLFSLAAGLAGGMFACWLAPKADAARPVTSPTDLS